MGYLVLSGLLSGRICIPALHKNGLLLFPNRLNQQWSRAVQKIVYRRKS